MPLGRTPSDHRRYQRDTVRATLGAEPAVAGKTVCYARVSSNDQSEQIRTQAAKLERHCAEAGFTDVEVITDPAIHALHLTVFGENMASYQLFPLVRQWRQL
ncbi:putative site-specific integrase-resolvase [Paraburkholderia sp. GAS42]